MYPKMEIESDNVGYNQESLRPEVPQTLFQNLTFSNSKHFGSSKVSPISKTVSTLSTKNISLSPTESLAKSIATPLSSVSTIRQYPYELKFMQNKLDSPYKR